MVPHPGAPQRPNGVRRSQSVALDAEALHASNAERGTRNAEQERAPGSSLRAPRSAFRAPDLRPLNAPAPIAVETGTDGEPVSVVWRGRRVAVAAVADRWRIDDEWWRTPISRLYRRLVLADDRLLTVFEDLLTGRWYVQRYRFGRAGEGESHGGTEARRGRRNARQ